MPRPISEIRPRIATSVVLLALAACGGGSGSESPPAPGGLQPTLASIQDNIFTPTCALSGCHGGAGAMLGLRLDDGFSYASLVDVTSFYDTDGTLLRVKPRDPDASFLINKLGVNPKFGDRMPLSGCCLQQVTIDVIRQWIQDGAQP